MDQPAQFDNGPTWLRYVLVGLILVTVAVAVAVSFNADPGEGLISDPEETPGPDPKIMGLPTEASDRDLTIRIDSLERVGQLVTLRYTLATPNGGDLTVDRLDVQCSRPDTGRVYTWEKSEVEKTVLDVAMSRTLTDVPSALSALDIDFNCLLRPPIDKADISFDVPLPDAGNLGMMTMEFPGGKMVIRRIDVRPGADAAEPASTAQADAGFTIDTDVWLDEPLLGGRSDPIVLCTMPDGSPLVGKQVRATAEGVLSQYAILVEYSEMDQPPPLVRLHLLGGKTAGEYRRHVRFEGVAIGPVR